MATYTLIVRPFYDQIYNCYRKIITVNTTPNGPLSTLTKKVTDPKLSPFQEQSICCPQEKCINVIMKIVLIHSKYFNSWEALGLG